MNRDVSLFWLLLHPQYNTRHKVWAQGLLNTLSADDSSTSGFCLVEEAPTLFIWEAGDQMVARAAVPLLKQFRYLLWGNRHTICNPRERGRFMGVLKFQLYGGSLEITQCAPYGVEKIKRLNTYKALNTLPGTQF